MKILLANDDGINAEGLSVLEKHLVSKGHTVWVCAPAGQRSTCSHALTLRTPVKIEKLSEFHYACDGYPADCVNFALHNAIPVGTPDVVISGINDGYNIGTDVIYSGTVGAAREGAFRGFPAIAVSAARQKKELDAPYEVAASFLTEHLEEFVKICPKQCFININVPYASDGKTWEVATLGIMDYGDCLKKNKDDYFSIVSYTKSKAVNYTDDTDYNIVENKGFIAVSSVRVLPATDDLSQNLLYICNEGLK